MSFFCRGVPNLLSRPWPLVRLSTPGGRLKTEATEKESDMSQQIMKLFSVLLLVGVVFAGAKTAYAFEIAQAVPNTNAEACMDVAGDHTTSGTAIEAYYCNDGFNEQW